MSNTKDIHAAKTAQAPGSLADQVFADLICGGEMDAIVHLKLHPEDTIIPSIDGPFAFQPHGQDQIHNLPYYSTDLTAAGKVLDFMRAAPARWYYEVTSAADRVRHRAKFVQTEYDDYARGGIAYGATPAEAICRAALQAISREQFNSSVQDREASPGTSGSHS